MLKKRGSLQLSINAIVILVMAMVVLGVGLTFIRGLFDQGSSNLGRAIDNADLDNPATAQNPITIDKSVEVKKQGSARFKIGYYNAGTAPVDAKPGTTSGYTLVDPTHIISCPGRESGQSVAAVGAATQFQLTSIIASVPSNTATGFEVIITPTDAVQPGVYVCSVQILTSDPINNQGPSGQVTVTVTS